SVLAKSVRHYTAKRNDSRCGSERMIASSLSKVKGTARWPPSCWNTTVSNWGKSTSFRPKNDHKQCGRRSQDSLNKYTKRHDVSKSTEPTSCGARWAASWRVRGLFHLTNAPVRHSGSRGRGHGGCRRCRSKTILHPALSPAAACSTEACGKDGVRLACQP